MLVYVMYVGCYLEIRMRSKDSMKEIFDELVAFAELHGIDLLTDNLSMSLMFPHKPGVALNLSIGSIFDGSYRDEEEELH